MQNDNIGAINGNEAASISIRCRRYTESHIISDEY